MCPSMCSSLFSGSSAPMFARHLIRRLGLPTWRWRALLGSVLLSTTVACHDLSGLTGAQALPSGTPDPSVYRTAAGALALYQTVLANFQFFYGDSVKSLGGTTSNTREGAFVDFVFASGLFTDELQPGDLGCTAVVCLPSEADLVDARRVDMSTINNIYDALQRVRNDATEGIGALAAYDAAASPALRGHLYAITGYTELFLADLYCSGVPLSTFHFNGTTSFTYAPSSTTRQVYQAALAAFDTALTLSSDSVRIAGLAWVGKARALIAVDDFPQAAQAAAHVPDGFAYQFLVDWRGISQVSGSLFGQGGGVAGVGATVSDREGLTGLPYRSGDTRTTAQVVGAGSFGLPLYAPVKYGGAIPGILPITVADWIEARLIQAEGSLQAGDPVAWLAQLNFLRKHATVPGQTDTLPTLTDPGTDSARVSLLFQERAYWLYLTGHRQGDLRRLVRQYHRPPQEVYPTGQYPLAAVGTYGGNVTVPIPVTEAVNPQFHGCLSLRA